MKKIVGVILLCACTGSAMAETIDFDQAVANALKANTDILNSKSDLEIAKATVEQTYSMFDFKLDGSVNLSNTKQEDTSGIGFSPEEINTLGYSLSLSEKTMLGGVFSLDLETASIEQIYGIGLLYPAGGDLSYHEPTLSLTYSQPILKDFLGRPDLIALKMADASIDMAKENLRNTVIEHVMDLKSAYLDIYLAEKVLKVQEESYKDNEAFYNQTVRMKKIGLRESKDVYQTKASLLNARAGITPSKDNIRRLKEMFFNLAGYEEKNWPAMDVRTVDDNKTTEVPETLSDKALDELAITQAMVKISRYNDELSRMQLKISRNALLPSLSVFGKYGIAGNEDSLGSGFSEMVSNEYNNYAVGVNFSMYLPNRASKGELAINAEKFNQSKETLDSLIKMAKINIRFAFKAIKNNKEDYELYKEARILSEKSLKIHNQHFAQGRITTRELLSAQGEYHGAKINEINAYVAYLKALNNWEMFSGQYNDYYKSVIKE